MHTSLAEVVIFFLVNYPQENEVRQSGIPSEILWISILLMCLAFEHSLLL